MRKNHTKGFTLIELLIVVAIIGIIAAIAIPNLLDAMNRSRFKRTESDMRAAGTGIEQYKVDHFNNAPGDADITALMTRLAAMEYMRQAAELDGFGVPFGYGVSNPGGWSVFYALASEGSNGGPTAPTVTVDATTGAVTPLTDGWPALNHKTWRCDIAFSNGNFLTDVCGQM